MAKRNAEERRNKILEILRRSQAPVSGRALSEKLGVSRQVIVTDIAILRQKHPDLIATNSGYLMGNPVRNRRVFKVRHDESSTAAEMQAIIDLGGEILDIFVEHRIYGTMRAPLDIRSKRDIDLFMEDMESGVSSPLSRITDGYHYHTVEARSERILDEVENMLRERGWLIEASPVPPEIYEPKNYGGR